MKTSFLVLSMLLAHSVAFANVIPLSPGQSFSIGRDVVTCGDSQPAPQRWSCQLNVAMKFVSDWVYGNGSSEWAARNNLAAACQNKLANQFPANEVKGKCDVAGRAANCTLEP